MVWPQRLQLINREVDGDQTEAKVRAVAVVAGQAPAVVVEEDIEVIDLAALPAMDLKSHRKRIHKWVRYVLVLTIIIPHLRLILLGRLCDTHDRRKTCLYYSTFETR